MKQLARVILVAILTAQLMVQGCYYSKVVVLKNPEKFPEEQPKALDDPYVTPADTLAAEVLADSISLSAMPPGLVEEPPGGGWIYRLTNSHSSRISKLYYDGDRMLEPYAYVRGDTAFTLMKTDGEFYYLRELPVSRIDSLEVTLRDGALIKPQHVLAFVVLTAVIAVTVFQLDWRTSD